jgi:hypothetical protein
MKRSGIGLLALVVLLVAGTSFAGPPLDGNYQSTDLGGPVNIGHYTEGWDASGAAVETGTTLNAESWDGMNLGTQWRYWCGTLMSDGAVLTDNVDANGNGNRTYMKTFVGGYIWLSGAGPWANGDADYPGTIDTYVEFETVTYEEFVAVAAVTNVQATAHFDNYTDACMTFYIGNGSLVASTDLGDAIPANYPDLLDTSCDATRTHGAAWDFFTVTLSIAGCTTPVNETTWGAVKSMYGD